MDDFWGTSLFYSHAGHATKTHLLALLFMPMPFFQPMVQLDFIACDYVLKMSG